MLRVWRRKKLYRYAYKPRPWSATPGEPWIPANRPRWSIILGPCLVPPTTRGWPGGKHKPPNSRNRPSNTNRTITIKNEKAGQVPGFFVYTLRKYVGTSCPPQYPQYNQPPSN